MSVLSIDTFSRNLIICKDKYLYLSYLQGVVVIITFFSLFWQFWSSPSKFCQLLRMINLFEEVLPNFTQPRLV